nr:hypothetical protein Iba_scaffold3818CG0040 [Ipomoea batatas]
MALGGVGERRECCWDMVASAPKELVEGVWRGEREGGGERLGGRSSSVLTSEQRGGISGGELRVFSFAMEQRHGSGSEPFLATSRRRSSSSHRTPAAVFNSGNASLAFLLLRDARRSMEQQRHRCTFPAALRDSHGGVVTSHGSGRGPASHLPQPASRMEFATGDGVRSSASVVLPCRRHRRGALCVIVFPATSGGTPSPVRSEQDAAGQGGGRHGGIPSSVGLWRRASAGVSSPPMKA